jgi:hypothetical protein
LSAASFDAIDSVGVIQSTSRKASSEGGKLDAQNTQVAVDIQQTAAPAGESLQTSDIGPSQATSSAANAPTGVFTGVNDSDWAAGGIALAGAGLVGFLATGLGGEVRVSNSRRSRALGVPLS